jgi:hypothetical protein
MANGGNIQKSTRAFSSFMYLQATGSWVLSAREIVEVEEIGL